MENFAGTGRTRGFDGLETTVQASQILERGGKLGKRVAVARHEREAASREFALRQNEVQAQVVSAYVELVAAQARLSLAAEPLALARETVQAATARVGSGAGSPAESARARAALAAAQGDYARAEAGVANARAALAATWGGSPADVTRVEGKLTVPADLPSADTFLAKLSTHNRLELQQAIIASRRAALQLEQAQTLQDVRVGGGVRFLREGSDAAFVAGFSVPIPFRNQNQGNIRAARETLAGAEQSMSVVEHELRVAFAMAWQDLQTASTVARNLRTDALPATQEAHDVVRHAYAQGELPLIDVLDAQRAMTALRREILDAEVACATALVRIEALTDSTFPITTELLSAR